MSRHRRRKLLGGVTQNAPQHHNLCRWGLQSVQTAAAGATPQVTGSFEAGIYCVKIADPVPLPSPAAFNITIAHP